MGYIKHFIIIIIIIIIFIIISVYTFKRDLLI